MAQETLSATQVVGRRIRELRRRRELSAQALADLCEQAGTPGINRQVITNLETGRRGAASIDEILVLAYVLNAPPVLLFVPVGWDAELQVAPGGEQAIAMNPNGALLWICGEAAPPASGVRLREWNEAAAPVTLTRRLNERVHELIQARGDPEQTGRALADLAQALDLMVETGMPIPPQPREWVDEMRTHGLQHPDDIPVHGQVSGDGD